MQNSAFLLDMDGVLYHGEQPISAAKRFLARINRQPHAFITNNSATPRQAVYQKLQRLGLPVESPAQIITSAEVTASWLHNLKPDFRYYAIGGEGIQQALQQVGKPDTQRAEFVVIGEGAGIDYQSLSIAANLILNGAQFIATNPDSSVDAYQNGARIVLPGCRALYAPLQIMTGQSPTILGKPFPALYEAGLQQLGCHANDCIMVGDRPDTDIKGAAELGMRTLLVRTGRFAPEATYPSELPIPDWDVNSLDEWST